MERKNLLIAILFVAAASFTVGIPSGFKEFLASLNQVEFCSLQQDELRLYYNNKQNYLLFKKP